MIHCYTSFRVNFNPRSPRGERLDLHKKYEIYLLFQSTLPTRGATGLTDAWAVFFSISIHAPHAGSDIALGKPTLMFGISIHAPHAGSDFVRCPFIRFFLISIHAPHAGSDFERDQFIYLLHHFNPRSPRGERLSVIGTGKIGIDFNPRSPRGERRI